MTRPVHIAALDRALVDAVRQMEALDCDVEDFLDTHINVIDQYNDLLARRGSAYSDVRNTEEAIRSLGYVVLAGNHTVPKGESIIGDRTYSSTEDERAARERAAAAVDGTGEETPNA